MIAELAILDPTGHVTLEWDPTDKKQVDEARKEFDKLKSCGYAFFVSVESVTGSLDTGKEKQIKTFKKTEGKISVRSLPENMTQTKELPKGRQRGVAVPPMRGG